MQISEVKNPVNIRSLTRTKGLGVEIRERFPEHGGSWELSGDCGWPRTTCRTYSDRHVPGVPLFEIARRQIRDKDSEATEW